jgi:hypothetical protein
MIAYPSFVAKLSQRVVVLGLRFALNLLQLGSKDFVFDLTIVCGSQSLLFSSGLALVQFFELCDAFGQPSTSASQIFDLPGLLRLA